MDGEPPTGWKKAPLLEGCLDVPSDTNKIPEDSKTGNSLVNSIFVIDILSFLIGDEFSKYKYD